MGVLLKNTLRSAGLVLLAMGGFLMWASGGRGDQSTVLQGTISRLGKPSPEHTATPGTLGIVTWNIAYARGVAGDKSGPWPRAHIVQHLNGIADAIQNMSVDIAALQEVDLDSARSHHIHQAKYLAERLGWSHFACVETWVQNYIPFPYWPPARHYGRMRSGQCVISAFPILKNMRYRLEQPEHNPGYYNLFYLHRAIQQVTVAVLGEELKIFNVHLEAFDAPNREKQARVLLDLIASPAAPNTLVLGDFNALPPEATKKSDFPDEPRDDYRRDPTLALFLERSDLTEVLRGLHGHKGAEHFTFPADAPTRRLDYLFFSTRFQAKTGKVLSELLLSDHLPVFARLLL